MTCSEFQDILPDMIDGEAKGEHAAHLNSCSECSELVSDLRAISEGAKLLCAADEPNSRIWANIQRTLEAEGIIRTPSQAGGVLVPFRRHRARWTWATAIAAVLALAMVLVVNNRKTVNTAANIVPSRASQVDTEEDELLAGMSATARSIYEENLKSVNTSIQDAQATLAQDPDNDEARYFLQDAYHKKAMVYELAMDRALQ